MAIDFDGSTAYLSASSTLLTNEPIDVVIYGNADIDTSNIFLFSLGNNGASGFYGVNWAGNVASDLLRATKHDDAGTAGVSVTSAGFTTGTWINSAASFISDTSRASFKDGGSKGTNTTSISDPTPDFIGIGVLLRSTAAGFFDGKLAECYVMDTNVSDANRAIIDAYGISPIWLIPFANIRAWYPMLNVSDLQNRVRNGYPNLAVTGTPSSAIHPSNIIYPQINGLIAC